MTEEDEGEWKEGYELERSTTTPLNKNFDFLGFGARFCLKAINFDENHKTNNKNIKVVKL